MIALLALLAALAAQPAPDAAPDAQPATTTPPVSREALEDIDAWERRSRVLLDGPDACIEFQGTARVDVALYTPGGWLGPGEQRRIGTTATFTGRLDHGTWTRLDATWIQDDPDDTVTFDCPHPMVGRLPETAGAEGGHVSIGASHDGTRIDVGDGSARALNSLDRLVEEIDPSITTAYTLWDESRRAVVLRQFVPLDDSATPDEMEVRTFFPQAGAPSALDVVFPGRVTFREGPIGVRVLNAQMHLRSRETALGVLPGVESASLVVGALGFTFGFEQRLSYERARACPD